MMINAKMKSHTRPNQRPQLLLFPRIQLSRIATLLCPSSSSCLRVLGPAESSRGRRCRCGCARLSVDAASPKSSPLIVNVHQAVRV